MAVFEFTDLVNHDAVILMILARVMKLSWTSVARNSFDLIRSLNENDVFLHHEKMYSKMRKKRIILP